MKLKSEYRCVLVLVDNLDNMKGVEVETVCTIMILLFRLTVAQNWVVSTYIDKNRVGVCVDEE